MSFSVSARRVGSHECDTMKRLYPGKVEHATNHPATMLLETDNAYLHFGGPKENFRPYLVLVGRPIGFEGKFPGDITQLKYDRDIDREPVEYVYELSRKNLANLVLKGLYEPGFSVPDVVRKNVYYLPCNCEMYYTEATFGDKEHEKKSCLMFIRPEDGGYENEENSLMCADDDMTLNGRELIGSGYEIHKYFEPLVDKEAQMEEESYLDVEDELTSEGFADSYEEALSAESPEDYLDSEDEHENENEGKENEGEEAEAGPEVDPEVYDAMKTEADALYEERKKRRELMGRMEGKEEDLIPEDELTDVDKEPDEFLGEDTEDEDDAEAAKRQKREEVKTNAAENIDTMQEVISAGKDLDPRAAQHVEKGVIEDARDALDASRGDRNIKDAPEFLTGEEPDIAEELNY